MLSPYRLFAKFDDWLVSLVEKGCHKLQKATGKTNFWLHRIASTGEAISIGCCIMAYYAHYQSWWIHLLGFHFPEHGGTVVVVIGLLFVMDSGFDALWGWKWREGQAFERLSHGLANTNKISVVWRVLRWLGVFLIAGELKNGTSEIWFACVVASYFLLACDPLPPCEGRVQEWLKKLNKKLIPVETT